MNDMAEFVQSHKVINFDGLGLAYSVNIVTSEVDQHDVFCPILLRIEKSLSKFFVL